MHSLRLDLNSAIIGAVPSLSPSVKPKSLETCPCPSHGLDPQVFLGHDIQLHGSSSMLT